jgi:putative ABC transport system substrate-binding protein
MPIVGQNWKPIDNLVASKVAVIAATGGRASVLAAKAATTTMPIVFTTGGDAVQQGFVASLNHPGGNLTGISWFGTQVSGKGLGLLRELIPNPWLRRQDSNFCIPDCAAL